jgi:NAD(P)H-hydrate epimerase
LSLLATKGVLAAALGLLSDRRLASGSTRNTRCESLKSMSTGYLNAEDAAALDAELMSSPGFALEQLMELAGLSVAEAVYQVLSPTGGKSGGKPKVLLVCGPGNNGGDGLVAARHLVFFGFECTVVYPKQSSKQHFINLVHQCQDVDVDVFSEMPSDLNSYDGIVDAIFGFSFKGEPREPFATALKQIMEAQQAGVPIISVDVPSGWNVDEGDVAGLGFVPEVLVSLTTPKESARSFAGRHFVGGRFLPPKLAKKYMIQMPPYPGVSQVMEVTMAPTDKSSTSVQGWEAEYAAYLEDKGRQERSAASLADDVSSPASASVANQNEEKPPDMSWEHQYAEYCIEKEARLAEEDARQIQEMKEATRDQ